MPQPDDAAGDLPARMGELATITVHVEFPDGSPRGIVAPGVTSENASVQSLHGDAAVMHLLTVQMRGEIEERLHEELRATLGPAATLDSLIIKPGSVEILMVIGLAFAALRDVNETVNAVEQLSGRVLGVVRWALRRMPRTTPSLPRHVVSGYWSRGALLLPEGPAAELGERERLAAPETAAAPEALAASDTGDRRAFDTTRVFAIYLLLVNVALLATLIALLFLRQ
jgi:hypothetical protein